MYHFVVMSKHRFVVMSNAISTNNQSDFDEGICFSNKKIAEKFRQKSIDEFNKELPEGVRHVPELQDIFRIVESDSNYDFTVCKTIEDGENEMKKAMNKGNEFGRIMPYDNKCGDFEGDTPYCGEYQNLYTVHKTENTPNGKTDTIVGMFTNREMAQVFCFTTGYSEIVCNRSIKEGIDFRKFFFIVDKTTSKAICFAHEKEALKYLHYLHELYWGRKTSRHIPMHFVEDASFLLCEAVNKYAVYNLDNCLPIHNNADDVIAQLFNSGFQTVSKDLVNDVLNENEKLWNVVGNQIFIVGQFTNEKAAKEFRDMVEGEEYTCKITDCPTELEKRKLAECEALKIGIEKQKKFEEKKLSADAGLLEKVMLYVGTVRFDDFKKSMGYADEQAEGKFCEMRGNFASFYTNLPSNLKETFMKVASGK